MTTHFQLFKAVLVALVGRVAGSWNRTLLAAQSQRGQATSEYGVVLLVAIALGMAVFALFTTGSMDTILQGFLKKALTMATSLIK